jgi:hypothetical protein
MLHRMAAPTCANSWSSKTGEMPPSRLPVTRSTCCDEMEEEGETARCSPRTGTEEARVGGALGTKRSKEKVMMMIDDDAAAADDDDGLVIYDNGPAFCVRGCVCACVVCVWCVCVGRGCLGDKHHGKWSRGYATCIHRSK